MKLFWNKQYRLREAVKSGHPDEVMMYLEKGADVHARDGDGLTPLHAAAEDGHQEVAELLIARGAEVSARDKSGRTPLHAAAEDGHQEVAELLIARGAEVSARDKSGRTPLHAAAGKGHEEVAGLLIARGADVHAKDDKGLKPHDHAAKNYHKKVADLLIARCRPPLHVAAREGRKDIAVELIVQGADVNARDDSGWTPLHFAASGGHEDVAELLISKGANVNAYEFCEGKCTPLYNAVKGGHRNVARLLYRHGAVGGYKILDGILIIFTRDFEPKSTFINSVLTKMKARGRPYVEWMTEKTSMQVLVSPKAQDPMTFLASAAVQFRTMGIAFSLENVEHATFEGSDGVSGTVVTHWST